VSEKRSNANAVIFDVAQAETINVWRKSEATVVVRFLDGSRITGRILRVGPFSIHFRSDSGDRDTLVFKTAIAGVSGPPTAELKTVPGARQVLSLTEEAAQKGIPIGRYRWSGIPIGRIEVEKLKGITEPETSSGEQTDGAQ
jgi:sRNA-binding regulator protein Hfq